MNMKVKTTFKLAMVSLLSFNFLYGANIYANEKTVSSKISEELEDKMNLMNDNEKYLL